MVEDSGKPWLLNTLMCSVKFVASRINQVSSGQTVLSNEFK